MSRIRMRSALWLLTASGGLILFSSAFVLLYAAIGVGCELGWDTRPLGGTNLLTALLGLVWVAHIVALGALQWYAAGLWRRADGPEKATARLLAAMTCLLAAAGLVSTVFVGFPILVLPPCA
jgi:hypothetical protein